MFNKTMRNKYKVVMTHANGVERTYFFNDKQAVANFMNTTGVACGWSLKLYICLSVKVGTALAIKKGFTWNI